MCCIIDLNNSIIITMINAVIKSSYGQVFDKLPPCPKFANDSHYGAGNSFVELCACLLEAFSKCFKILPIELLEYSIPFHDVGVFFAVCTFLWLKLSITSVAVGFNYYVVVFLAFYLLLRRRPSLFAISFCHFFQGFLNADVSWDGGVVRGAVSKQCKYVKGAGRCKD